MARSALQRRCLTDTLMEVPSEQDYELRRRGSSVRTEIFELVRQHLQGLAFPKSDGECTLSGLTEVRLLPSMCACDCKTSAAPIHPSAPHR